MVYHICNAHLELCIPASSKPYHARRVDQNRIFTPYMKVYLVISLLEISCIHRIYMVLANFYTHWTRSTSIEAMHMYRLSSSKMAIQGAWIFCKHILYVYSLSFDVRIHFFPQPYSSTTWCATNTHWVNSHSCIMHHASCRC